MKKILFPTDFSINADNALNYAIKLCESLNAELIIFHACRVNALAYQLLTEETNEEVIIETATEKLNAYCKRHASESGKIKISQEIEYGFAVDTIVEASKRLDAQLIVMGTKGAKGLDEVLLGSNTMAVIEKSTCPVLAVPEKSTFGKINQIVFATDFKENDMESIKFLSEIAGLFKAGIVIVHAAEYPVFADYEKALMDIFAEDVRKHVSYKNISFRVLKGTNHAKALNDFIVDNHVDMIAVSTRRKNIFTRFFDSSFTKKVAYHNNIPLLAFHVK